MIVWNVYDRDMAAVVAERMADDVIEEPQRYGDVSVDKLEALGRVHSGLLLTGENLTKSNAEALLREVVRTEIEHWVPDASQRLIQRASAALGIEPPLDPAFKRDHGPLPQDHALVMTWVCGWYVARCATCAHLFKV